MYPYFLLLILILTNTTHSPPSSHPATQPPSPAFPVHFSQTPSHQLNNAIDSILAAGDFSGWANILSSIDSSTLPLKATLFIPTNDAIAKTANSTGTFLPDSFLIPYHIVPQRLTFADLRNYPVMSKLPTLLPTRFIVVTNDSADNFTIDGTRITHPDLYLSASFAVHGVMNVLDYAVYGNGVSMEKNGTLAKNETTTVEEKREPVKGNESVVVSKGDWLGSSIWISVGAVMLGIMGVEYTVGFVVMVFVLARKLLNLIFVSVLMFVTLLWRALLEFFALLGGPGVTDSWPNSD